MVDTRNDTIQSETFIQAINVLTNPMIQGVSLEQFMAIENKQKIFEQMLDQDTVSSNMGESIFYCNFWTLKNCLKLPKLAGFGPFYSNYTFFHILAHCANHNKNKKIKKKVNILPLDLQQV